MAEVLLKRGNNYCQTRLSAWKVDREEKRLKAKLRRPYNG